MKCIVIMGRAAGAWGSTQQWVFKGWAVFAGIPWSMTEFFKWNVWVKDKALT